MRRILKYAGALFLLVIIIFVVWQKNMPAPSQGDWQDVSKVQSTAEFNGDTVTVRNVRNFQYNASGTPVVENYYDKVYNLNKLKKIWYVVAPFDASSPFAHTFLSFEFTDDSYLAITIEARLTKAQHYSSWNGFVRTFPLIYIAADERDIIYPRAAISKDDVYLYPLTSTPAKARLLFIDMLHRMNSLVAHPEWYNSIFANCTSSIADHVNKISPGILPRFDWQVLLTSYADELALDKGLIDSKLPIDQARERFYITDKSLKIGRVDNYSELVRQQSKP